MHTKVVLVAELGDIGRGDELHVLVVQPLQLRLHIFLTQQAPVYEYDCMAGVSQAKLHTVTGMWNVH